MTLWPPWRPDHFIVSTSNCATTSTYVPSQCHYSSLVSSNVLPVEMKIHSGEKSDHCIVFKLRNNFHPPSQVIIHLQCHQMFCMWRLCTPQAEHLVCSSVSNCLFLGVQVLLIWVIAQLGACIASWHQTPVPNKVRLTFKPFGFRPTHTHPHALLKSYSHFR